MKKLTTYQAEDGEVFDTALQCYDHDKQLIADNLYEAIDLCIGPFPTDATLAIINNRAELMGILESAKIELDNLQREYEELS